ncbi:MAG: invasion protein CiaB [Candidatus Gracilibacteria bacterium]|nr:invasion protein CiaB [Candidatus Gracilibacteria bacterium]
MDKKTVENNLKLIVDYNNRVNSSLKEIYSGVANDNEYREILEEFLEYICLESNDETRLGAYFRLIDLKENSLVLYMEKQGFSQEKIDEILDLSYEYTSEFHFELQSDLIDFIEKEKLLTDFYLEIFNGVHSVGKAFNDFFLPWRNHIVNGVNRDLEKKFNDDSSKIINFLNENNLLDLGHFKEQADRSYSALCYDENNNFISKSYVEAFDFEIKQIVVALDIFITNLEKQTDEIYDSKKEYLEYLNAIKNAFLETDVNSLVAKWALVDETWMQIKTPFQISHPLEFYEDKYRKAVAPEWDLRIQNRVFESVVEKDILNMYETFYKEIGKEKFRDSYNYSFANINRVQLYLTSPVLYYSSELTGLFSAQVVPNDDVVSDKFGKKIFAFPEMVLENKRSMPFMKFSSIIFDSKLLDNYRKYLFSDSKNFYKIYDIETIGHEFGHTLWLDLDNETIMNKKTGVYKNIEEFKATTGGLVAYFMGNNLNLELSEKLITDHVMRTIGLFAYKKVNEVEPYYCEALIHFQLLLESRIIDIIDNKIVLDFNIDSFTNLKETYINHYVDLINIYLSKTDAMEFLKRYTIKEGLYYLPQNEFLRNFVNYFYETYEKVGNEVDDSISKDKYLNN